MREESNLLVILQGELKSDDKITVSEGQSITLTNDYTVKGDENLLAVSYEPIARDVCPGSKVLIADGSLTLEVESCNPEKGLVECKALNTASIGPKKNVNLPGIKVNLPILTQKDMDDIGEWGIENKVSHLVTGRLSSISHLIHRTIAMH